MRISSLLARRRITEGGACAIGASCALISASATRAPMSAMARSSMVPIRRSSTSSNSAICSSSKLPAEDRNRSVTRRAVSRPFSAEPVRIADSTSSMIDSSAVDMTHCSS